MQSSLIALSQLQKPGIERALSERSQALSNVRVSPRDSPTGDLIHLPRDSSTGNLVQRFESACRRFQAVRACIEGVISETSQTLTDLRVSPRDSPTGELVQLVRRSFRYFAVAAWDQVQINSQLEICCKYIEHNKAFLETEFSEPISQFLWEVCGFDELWIFESLASDYLEMDLLDF